MCSQRYEREIEKELIEINSEPAYYCAGFSIPVKLY